MTAIDTSALSQKLQELVQTIDLFVNGQTNDIVAISNGRTISTLSSLSQKIAGIKYIQKIIDYQTLAKATSDALAGVLIVPGNVVRVYGETNVTLNRLYQVQTNLSLVQIDYTDIYDLKNALPYPENNRLMQFNLVQLNDPNQNSIVTYNVQPSTSIGFSQFLEGTMKVVSQKPGVQGTIIGKFTLMIWLEGTTLQTSVKWYSTDAMAVAGSTFNTTTLPTIEASLDTTNPTNYLVKVFPSYTTSLLNTDSVLLEFSVSGVNRSSFY